MARKRTPQPHPSGLEVVKGEGVPLTATQRELVGIFVQYLKRLPEPNEDDMVRDKSDESPKTVWDSNRYSSLNRLLGEHFLAIYPEWDNSKRTAGGARNIQELPNHQGDEFEWWESKSLRRAVWCFHGYLKQGSPARPETILETPPAIVTVEREALLTNRLSACVGRTLMD